MASFENGDNKSNGVAFLVSAGIVYEIIAAACSSPQTAEINATKRADTLMKWVNIGAMQSAAFIGIAAVLDPSHRMAIIGGGLTAGVIMYGCYIHALESGMSKAAPSTED